MKLNKKVFAVVMGLAITASGSVFAATADSFTDVPKDHWSYQALDYLAKEGVIEGMGDSTFQGGRSMTRYEVASIVAKAMQKGNLGIADSAVLEKLEKEYGGELATLKKQVDENTKQIAENKSAIERVNLHGFVRTQWDNDNIKGENQRDRDRFYMNLYGDFKVSDQWTARFQSETNHRWSGNTYDPSKTHQKSDGTIQRIWVDGTYGKGGWISIGRTWRGLGFQNVLQGGETDGVQFGYPITKQGLQVSGYYMAPSWEGADYNFYGVAFFGPIGHNFDINVAYAKLNKGKNEDLTTTSGSGNWIGSQGWVISAASNLGKNFRLIGDYVKTNHEGDNDSKAIRLNYKGASPEHVGSFGLYARYIDYGQYGMIGGDDEWGSLRKDSRGEIFGVTYTPWKNVVWETLYERAKTDRHTAEYTRNLFRTQMDFHF